jgi:hypothetical protein
MRQLLLMMLTQPPLLVANYLLNLLLTHVPMQVFGMLEFFQVLLQQNKIVLELMLEFVLEHQIVLVLLLANGTDNFVLLARHLDQEFKLRHKLMVFQTIVTLVQKLLQQLKTWTLLLGGHLRLLPLTLLQHRMKLILLSVIFKNQQILKFQQLLDTQIQEPPTIPCGVLPHLVSLLQMVFLLN